MRRRDDKFTDNGFEAWGGYMQAKISKLEDQFSSRASKEETQISDIFSGVSIYVNGYTTPSADELKTLMSKHAGVYHTYQRSDDFIIASNLPDTKVKNMSLARVVRPEWITDSIAANRLLDYRDYLLYRNSRTQPKLNFNKPSANESKLDNIDKTATNCKQDEAPSNVTTSETPDFDEVSLQTNVNDNKVTISNKSSSLKHETIRTEHIPKTAVDPNFISEFYNNSRLHHISQMGASFKQYVNDLRETSNFLFPARFELKDRISSIESTDLSPIHFENGKVIMHIDMDCFFVSVGLRNRPDLKGKPVGVTHSKGGNPRPKRSGVDRSTEFNLYKQKQAQKLGKALGKPDEEIVFESRVDNIEDEGNKFSSMSEIASCSYEARAKGIKNGMFMGQALRLCPYLQTIPYDFEGYKEVAYTLYNTIAKYTLDIEAVSCDEMYVDCTELLKEINVSAQDFATALRDEIKNKTGCPCSTGFGGNRLQARLATKRAKPDGQFLLTAELVQDFMFDIKLRDLPGVGRQTAHKLEALGHETCGSLQSLDLVTLQKHLGNKTGAQLRDQCQGRDPNPLTFHTVRKSVSAEVNYGIRFENNDQCLEFLKQLSGEVHNRMKQFKVMGKCITLKLMVRAEDAPVETAKFMGHGFCDVINKSNSLNNATDDLEVITKEVISLCRKQNIDPKEMRGIGIQITKLESIKSRQVKGTINKFFSTNYKNNKSENKVRVSNNDVNDVFQNENMDLRQTTPKKVKTSKSPEKKSPIIGSLKSSPARKRGRPPKSLKLQNNTSKNLMNKFLGQTTVKDTPYKDPMIKPTKNTSPPAIRASVLKEIREEKKTGLLGLPWEKIRELLRAWLDSGQTPLPCDVSMVTDYMREMVVSKNIEKLNILINFLKRRTSEMNSEQWKTVCDNVITQVQNAMIAVYGKKLYIDYY